jgi:hypothetical protein
MSSKAVANEVMEEGALSVRREGLRVEVEETTDLVSASRSRSRSRLERAVSGRRRRVSSSLSLGADEPLSFLPVSRLHMMCDRAGGPVWVRCGCGRGCGCGQLGCACLQ